MTKEGFIDEFINCVKGMRNVDYADATSVNKYNRLSIKTIKVARLISEKYPEYIPNFAKLLQYSDWDVKLSCASCLIQNINCSEYEKHCAINTIMEYISTHDNVQAMGWRMKLKDLGLL